MANIQSSTRQVLTSVYQYAQPSAGTTVVMNSNTAVLVLEPAGSLLTLTVTLPTAPLDGQLARITSSQTVTTLTLGAGALSIVGGLAAFAANGSAQYIYREANTTWYRCG